MGSQRCSATISLSGNHMIVMFYFSMMQREALKLFLKGLTFGPHAQLGQEPLWCDPLKHLLIT